MAREAVPRHHPRWEPGALAAPAGICAGGGEQSPSLPRPPAPVNELHQGAAAEEILWLTHLLARKPFKVVAVALANKMAQIAWPLLAKGGAYRPSALATP